MNLKTAGLVTVFIFVCYAPMGAAQTDKTLFLVRHAEKMSDAGKDPALTERGVARANNLAKMLQDKKIQVIYSTNYRRTMQTAAPLARLLQLEVQHYDPRDLPGFAEKIKNSDRNALIVGHSNTTPMLTHLLGGNAHGDIDDSEYTRLYQLDYHGAQVSTQLLSTKPDVKRAPTQSFQFDLNRLSDQQLTFAMHFNGQPVGKATQSIKREGDKIVLAEKTVIEKMNIDADIHITADAKTLAPLSMTMTGSMGKPVDIHLNWQDSRLTGHSEMARAPYKQQGRITLDRAYSPQTIERSTAIMLAHLAKVKPEQAFSVEWFDAYSTDSKMIEVSYQGEEKVTVPAGTFETYKVRYQGGAPSQLFYISKGPQPKVVKIEVIAMPWVYELLE